MLALFALNQTTLLRVARTMRACETLERTGSWRRLEMLAHGASCSIVVLPWLELDGGAAQLSSLRSRAPFSPLVLVTTKDANNARALGRVGVEEVVWLHEIDAALAPAVSRACAQSLLRRVASALEQADRLAPRLRSALAFACRSEAPIRSEAELAKAAGCHRRTLWYHWRRALGGGSVSLRLEDFLDWLLVLRAAGRKTSNRGWHYVAESLGVHEHTIARLAKHLAGVSLSELGFVDRQALVERFGKEVLHPLLGSRAYHILG
jgi:hypothetical protein